MPVVGGVFAIVRAGARGYVTKTVETDELVEAISGVANGDAVFSPRLAGFVLDAFSGALPDDYDMSSTSCRLVRRRCYG